MKRQTKKILVYAAAALAIIVLVAGLIMLLRKDSFGDNYFARNKAVATVNGAKITKNEFASSVSTYYNNIDTYNMYALYGYGQYYDTTTESGMKSLKNDILNDLIDAEVYIQLAKELGITLTGEEQAEVAQSAKDTLASLKEQILESAKSSGSQNPETYATTMLANYFSSLGISQKTFLKRSEHSALAQKYATKLQEHYTAERNVTDAELKDIYAEYAKTYYQDAYVDGYYAQQTEYLSEGYTDTPYLYIPEDFLFVQVIQLSDGDKAEETLTKIEAGEDFEAYRTAEDNENAIAKNAAADKGLAIGENDSIFDDVVYMSAKNMSEGEVQLVQSVTKDSDGNEVNTYFIVKRISGATGIVPYEEVKDVIDSTLTSYATSNYYNEQLDAWRDKANIVIDDDVVNAFDPAA